MNIATFRNQGRMGNFLFEAATTLAYSWKHGLDFAIPTKTKNPVHNPIYLQHLKNPHYREEDPSVLVQEQGHAYQEIPFLEEWRDKKNIILQGYWQSEKYFKEYRSRIIESFGFPWKPMKGYVSVHVRRGDYLRLTEKHPPVPVSWITGAMEHFPGFHFIFFSDDIPWCKAVFGRRKDVSFSNNNNEVKDLVQGTWCEHHICSASTFSWWQAWLNQNPHKKIIIPKQWFMPGRKEDTRDIVPEEWTKL